MLKKRCIALMAIIVLITGLSACKDTRPDKEIFLEKYENSQKDSSYDSFDNWYSIKGETVETTEESITTKTNKFIGYLDFKVVKDSLFILVKEFEQVEETMVTDTYSDCYNTKTIVKKYFKDKKFYYSEECFKYRPDKERKETAGSDDFYKDIYLKCDRLPKDFHNPLKYINSYPDENVAFSKELRNVTLYSFFDNKVFSERDSDMNEVKTLYDEDVKIDFLYDSKYRLHSIEYLNLKRTDTSERFKFLSSYSKMEFKLAKEKEIIVPGDYEVRYQIEGKEHFVNI